MSDLSYNPEVMDTTVSRYQKEYVDNRQMHDISLVKDTMAHVTKVHKPVHLEGLIVQTTGMTPNAPVQTVIEQTTKGVSSKADKGLMKSGVKSKTMPKSMGQVPYTGKKY